jgi:hypothetical protein
VKSDFEAERSVSLAGLHLVLTGLSSELALLAESCIVVKTRKREPRIVAA